jgi:hypothetical protein
MESYKCGGIPMDSPITVADANAVTLAFEACQRGKDSAGLTLALFGRR